MRAANLPHVRIKGEDVILFGVYQDWVPQNPGNHMDGGITEDGKWQAKWKKLVYFPTQRYDTPFGKIGRKFVSTLPVDPDVI